MSRTVLFLCPHNAAKSVIAAADFARLAAERGLAATADSAGTQPDQGPAPAVVAALRAEGVDVGGHRPRLVTADDLAGAWRVVSLGCDPAALEAAGSRLVRWDDVPPPTQGLAAVREDIRRRVAGLVEELAGAGGA